MTVHQVATATGYSHDYMRKRLREALDNDEIEGAKVDQVIACNIRGGTVVLTASREGMLDSLEEISKSLADRARSETSGVEDLQAFIRRHATSTYQIERRWKFWYPTTRLASASSSSAAAADD